MRYDFREKAVEGGLAALALLSLAVLAGIVFYLFREGLPVFASTGFLDFVFGTDWYPVGDQPDFEIGSLIAGSLAVTFLASLFAVPLGLMTAAYLSEVAANTTRRIIKPFIELLAALPSVVIGFIGMVLVAPWLQNTLGIATGLNLFNAALMLAFMAVPTICECDFPLCTLWRRYRRDARHVPCSRRNDGRADGRRRRRYRARIDL